VLGVAVTLPAIWSYCMALPRVSDMYCGKVMAKAISWSWPDPQPTSACKSRIVHWFMSCFPRTLANACSMIAVTSGSGWVDPSCVMLIMSGGVCGSLSCVLSVGGGLGGSPKVGGSGGDVAVGAGIGDGCSAPPSLGLLLLLLISPGATSLPAALSSSCNVLACSSFMALEAPRRIVLAPLQA